MNHRSLRAALVVLAPLGFAACGTVEEILDGLPDVCSRPALVVTTFEEGDDEFRLCGDVCTLRDAIVTANACGTPQVVQLSEGTYSLSAQDHPLSGNPRIQSELLDARYGPAALPRITGDITVRGANATIERASDAPPFRILHVSGGRLVLEQLTIANGNAPGRSDSAAGGGAIFASHGEVTLRGATLRNNRATHDGGAIDGGYVTVLEGSVIRDNVSGANGGGASAAAGVILRSGSVVSNNFAAARGGGIYGTGISILESENATISNNSADEGGGIFATSEVTLIIEKSLISGNTARRDGGGILLTDANGYVRVSASTITGNVSQLGTGAGIDINGGYAVMEDVTVTLNAVNATSGAALSIRNGAGGGYRNLIVADNLGDDCAIEIRDSHTHIEDQNLQSDGTCAGFSITAPGDLGPLQNNGGQTLTHLPLRDSAAINSGENCLPVDQRGLSRPVSVCDIGAVEVQASDYPLDEPPIFEPPIVPPDGPPFD